jgi:hypothetical protein
VSVTAAAYVWKCPEAQYGLQSFTVAIPLATACFGPQDDHLRFVK